MCYDITLHHQIDLRSFISYFHIIRIKLFFLFLFLDLTTIAHTCNLSLSPPVNKIGAYVVCYILGEFFHLPVLSQLCLTHVQSLLTVDSALALVPFAEAINCPLLKELSVAYLKIHHTP